LYQVFKQSPALRRLGSRSETGPVAAVCISGQSKLGNQQQAASSLLYVDVHPVGIIREHPVGQYALQQSVRLFLAVTTLNANQGKYAFFGLSNHFFINMNCGFGYPL